MYEKETRFRNQHLIFSIFNDTLNFFRKKSVQFLCPILWCHTDPSWWKVRKQFSYLVYGAQNPQAPNAEKLHMQKAQRDVPQTSRDLENANIKWIFTNICAEFKGTPQALGDSKLKEYNVELRWLCCPLDGKILSIMKYVIKHYVDPRALGVFLLVTVLLGLFHLVGFKKLKWKKKEQEWQINSYWCCSPCLHFDREPWRAQQET